MAGLHFNIYYWNSMNFNLISLSEYLYNNGYESDKHLKVMQISFNVSFETYVIHNYLLHFLDLSNLLTSF